MAIGHHVEFLKAYNFIWWQGREDWVISLCEIFFCPKQRGIAIFRFSKGPILPSWIPKFVKFHWQTVSGRPILIIVLNVVKTGRSVAEILWFFEFSRWPLLSSFWKSGNFIGYCGAEGRDASACQILSKSVNWLTIYYDFSIFQDGGRPPS